MFLLDFKLFRLRQKYGVAKRFSREALDRLSTYHWPGNVRQLNSLATSGYAMADGDTIGLEDFEAQLDLSAAAPSDSAEDLLERMPQETFWQVVYEPFMKRDLNRGQVRAVIKKGLVKCGGRYDRLVESFSLPKDDYQRFMDFLRHHQLKP